MAKFFATVVYVIEADDLAEARDFADQLASTPDCPSFVERAWVDEVEETDEEDEPWGSGLDD